MRPPTNSFGNGVSKSILVLKIDTWLVGGVQSSTLANVDDISLDNLTACGAVADASHTYMAMPLRHLPNSTHSTACKRLGLSWLVNGRSCGVCINQQYCVASCDERFNHSLVALLGRVCGSRCTQN